jgi:16S rRNA (adenine(1408)-N(1))-methyltransferase
MEQILGKTTQLLDADGLASRTYGYHQRLVDVGTGDGRFVLAQARTRPDTFVLGVDACRENLRTAARGAPDNALFLIANAQRLPPSLAALATEITVNFPWGSLLTALLDPECAVADRLAVLAQPGATIALRLNGEALSSNGWSLDAGAAQVSSGLRRVGFVFSPAQRLDAHALRALPTTWAKRLAFGRDPRAIAIQGVFRPHRR